MIYTNRDWENYMSIKEDWIKALRSGKYKQGTGCLRKGNEYCCLGVLCEVLDLEFIPLYVEDDLFADIEREIDNKLLYGIQGNEGGIPHNILRTRKIKINQDYFVELNDGREFSFEQIANVLEIDKGNLFSE